MVKAEPRPSLADLKTRLGFAWPEHAGSQLGRILAKARIQKYHGQAGQPFFCRAKRAALRARVRNPAAAKVAGHHGVMNGGSL